MQVVESKEKNTFDRIIEGIKENEMEQAMLVRTLIAYNDVVPMAKGMDDNYKGYLDTLNHTLKECFDINSKELEIYRKMLHYLKLLLFNNQYDRFAISNYFFLFEETLLLLEDSKRTRVLKEALVIKATSMGMRFKADGVTIMGDIDELDINKHVDLYDDILENIPRR